MSTTGAIMKILNAPVKWSSNKVSVIGSGSVGLACIFGILVEGSATELAIVDLNEDKLKGEMLDLQQGTPLLGDIKVYASPDYSITAGSKICVVTAGVRQKEGESRLALVQRNTDVLKDIIPCLVQHSPDTIILMVSNPADVLTYVAWKLSGLPKHRIIGAGTTLDTCRFRYFLAEKLGAAPSCCHGWIIGEHGDNSVAVWSSVNIAGARLKEINKNAGKAEGDPENWNELHKKVINCAYEVISLKGYTCWAIGSCVTHLVKMILRNTLSIEAVATFVKGTYGIEEDVTLSIPCVIGEGGIVSIIEQTLSCPERMALQKTAKLLYEVQNGLKF